MKLPRIHLCASIAAAVLFAAIAVGLFGCASRSEGGAATRDKGQSAAEAARETIRIQKPAPTSRPATQPAPARPDPWEFAQANGSFEVRIDREGVQVSERHDVAATSQPSVTSFDGMPNWSGGAAGSLAGLSWTQVQRNAGPLWLGVIFLVLAGGAYWLNKPVLAVACLAGGVLSFVWPLALGVFAVGALVFLILKYRGMLTQVVRSVDNALEHTPPEWRAVVKGKLKEVQDEETRRKVDALRAV